MEGIRKKRIRGVIFITQKFCEPYNYLFYAYKKALDGLGIQLLQLKMSDSADGKTEETVLGAYAERIWGKRVLVQKDGAYLSALGCALLARGEEKAAYR